MAKRPAKTSSTPEALTGDPLKDDFRNVLWLVWNHINLPEPTWVQYDIAKFMQNGPRRSIIEAFRGVGKSFIAAAYTIFTLNRDPQAKIMVVSASKSRADDFSTFVLRLLEEIPQFAHLRPVGDQRSSKEKFDVGPAIPDQSPSVKSVGITGQLTGSRADLIIADDVEVAGNSSTQGLRDKLLDAIKEFDAVLKPNGRVLYLGTPQTEQSIYNALPDRGYVIRVWPARYPTEAQIGRYGSRLAPSLTSRLLASQALSGTPTDPVRFTDQDLEERRLSYGSQGFALQFMLDTSLADADRYPLKLKDLIVHPLDPGRAPLDFMWASGPDQALSLQAIGLQGDRYHKPGWVSQDVGEYEGSVMFIDPSGRGKDETAYAIIKALHGRLFLVSVGGYRDGYSEDTLKALVGRAKEFGVNHILCEPNYGGGMFTSLLRGMAVKQGYPVTVEDDKAAKTQKEARIIDTLEPVLMQHRLVVCPSVIEADFKSTEGYKSEEIQSYRLFYQMTRMTRERGALGHDDRLDALAGAVSYWVDIMSRDIDSAVQDHKSAALEADLDAFMETIKTPGRTPKVRRYVL